MQLIAAGKQLPQREKDGLWNGTEWHPLPPRTLVWLHVLGFCILQAATVLSLALAVVMIGSK